MQVIVFSGIQGAGKSTFYKQRFFATHVRISLDLLKTRNREDILLFACLAAQQPVVIDNTNPTADQRGRYAQLAAAAKFASALYFFEADVTGAISRNASRPEAQRVPEIAIYGTHAKLQRPTRNEGFDQIFIVRVDASGEFVVSEHSDEV